MGNPFMRPCVMDIGIKPQLKHHYATGICCYYHKKRKRYH